MRKLSLFGLATLVFSISYTSSALACGKVSWSIASLYGEGPMASRNAEDMLAGLAKVGGPCQRLANEEPYKNEERIFELLLRPPKHIDIRPYGKKIFEGFRCLRTQKDRLGYGGLTRRYNARCVYEDVHYVTSKNGANLRKTPEVTSNNRLTSLERSAVLQELSTEGEWIEVKVLQYSPFGDRACKYETPCRKGWVHESVVKPD